MMKRRLLGATGRPVSELCLGTMSFGWRTPVDTALSLLDEFHDSGGNVLEAAGICPGLIAQPDWFGLPEACIGEWLATRGIARDQLVVATRLVWSPSPASTGGNLASCCEASLRRLRTDHLDVLVCDWTPETPQLADVFDGLLRLVDQGKIRHVGVSGFAAWRTTQAPATPPERSAAIDLVQADYSLLERGCEPDLFSLGGRVRPAFLARSPLAGGFLAVPAERWPIHDRHRRTHLRLRYGNARAEAVRAAVRAVAEELGVTSGRVALAWVLSNPGVSAAIIAPLSLGQLKDAVRVNDLELTLPQLRRLDLISGCRDCSSNPELGSTPARAVREESAVVVPFEP